MEALAKPSLGPRASYRGPPLGHRPAPAEASAGRWGSVPVEPSRGSLAGHEEAPDRPSVRGSGQATEFNIH